MENRFGSPYGNTYNAFPYPLGVALLIPAGTPLPTFYSLFAQIEIE